MSSAHEPPSPPVIPEPAPAPAAGPAAPAPPTAPPAAVHAGHAPYAAPAGAAAGRQRKSPVLAGLLSLMPGAGQIYVGYYKLGFIHNIIFGMNIAFLAAASPFSRLLPAASIFLAFFVIYNIVDASRRATCYNLALDGVEGIELPSLNDASLPFQNLRGSVGGGVILIAVGAILLSNTLLGIPLDWLAAWWPVAPLGLGVHLLAKGLKER